jgi:hypothetical protein
VHEKIDSDFYIEEPHQNIVEDIERMAEEFEKPNGIITSSDLLEEELAE